MGISKELVGISCLMLASEKSGPRLPSEQPAAAAMVAAAAMAAAATMAPAGAMATSGLASQMPTSGN